MSSTLEDQEKKLKELIDKRHIVLGDKEKLAELIVEMDKKKHECIRKTHVEVNKNLHSIFSSLLPGTSARLDANDDFTGFEMKVGFSGV